LKKFESRNDKNQADVFSMCDQMDLYQMDDTPLRQKLKAINVEEVSPKHALEILYELKAMVLS
jgi:DNA mismatch repair ATPase MutS